MPDVLESLLFFALVEILTTLINVEAAKSSPGGKNEKSRMPVTKNMLVSRGVVKGRMIPVTGFLFALFRIFIALRQRPGFVLRKTVTRLFQALNISTTEFMDTRKSHWMAGAGFLVSEI